LARFLFLTWDGSGNQVPQIGLAQALGERGHTVEFGGYASQRPRLREAGMPLHVLAEADRALAAAAGERAVVALRRGVWTCPGHLVDVPEIVAERRPDVLVVDCMMYAALAAAEKLDLPVAVLVHSTPSALAPPGGRSDDQFVPLVNDVRAAAGLGPVRRLWDTWSQFPTLCATLPELDPLASEAPASFAYFGPVFERVDRQWCSPWPADDRRPLVVVSFSTSVVWDQASRLARTINGLAGGGCRVMVSTGRSEFAASPLADNVWLAPSVPHAAVLPEAAVLVTHAGHGSLTAALAHGVPLVCLPNPKSDQPHLAECIHDLGAGLALDGETATPAEIAAAVGSVLMDPSYAAAARHLASRIQASNACEAICLRLEELASAHA